MLKSNTLSSLIDRNNTGKGLWLILNVILVLSFHLLGQEFLVPLQVTDGNQNSTLQIGIHPNGTSGFDVGLDILAPPPPPAGAFDARLSWDNTDYFTDVRDNQNNEKTFVMTYAASTGHGPIVISWDSASLSSLGTFIITDNVTGQLFSLDMTTASSLDISSAGGLLNPGLRILMTPLVNIDPYEHNVPRGELLNLYPNYPNPFNGTTEISFYVGERSAVRLQIYNLVGQKVKELLSGEMLPGVYRITWDGTFEGNTPVASGIYFAVLSGSKRSQMIKIVYTK